jgi:hypothetical protein
MIAESAIKASIRLVLGNVARNVRLFNNAQGVATNQAGQVIKYGVCHPGGSDLIGWTTQVITPAMVGTKVAIFTAAEVKTYNGAVRPEQKNFLEAVKAAGGIAGIVRSADDAIALVQSAPGSA